MIALILFCMLIIAYWLELIINRYDILAPSSILIMGYMVGIFSFLLSNFDWQVSFSAKAMGVILLGITSFSLGSKLSMLGTDVLCRGESTRNALRGKESWDVGNSYLKRVGNLISFCQIVVTVQTFLSMRRVVGGGSISSIISSYRAAVITSSSANVRISNLVVMEQKFFAAFSFVLIFYFLYQILVKRERPSFVMLFPSFFYGIQQLLLGGRLQVIRLLLMFFVIFCAFQWYNQTWNGQTIKKISKIVIVTVLLTLPLFYLSKFFLGRSSNEGMLDYILRYIGGSTAALSIYLDNSTHLNDSFGRETFMGIYDFIGRQTSVNGLTSLSWAVSPSGISIGNVYGADRRYFSDFGLKGVIILNALMGFFYGGYYRYLKLNWRNHNLKPISTIIYAYIFYAVFFQFVEGFFFMSVISVNTVLQVILIIFAFGTVNFLRPKSLKTL